MCTVDNDLRCAVEARTGKLPMEMPRVVVRGSYDVKHFFFWSADDSRFIHSSSDRRELAPSLVLHEGDE